MPYGSDVLLDPGRSFLFRTFNTVAFRHADWVTCDAEFVKEKIVHDYAFPAEKITVIPWGIDVEGIVGVRASAREEVREELSWQDKFVVIMTRNHEPVYGIDVFLNAMESVLRECHEVRVLMVGGGSLHEKYRSFVRDRGLESVVHFTGKIPHEQLIRTLQAADLYVSTSHSDGTSVSLMEAMASQLPVVVTDVPSNLEWIRSGRNGEVVPRGDSETLAHKIAELSRLPGRNSEYGKANLEIVRARGDWKQNFREIEHIYRRLVQ
jgi:glycosyltransferase involved in cell wall biosynthesis